MYESAEQIDQTVRLPRVIIVGLASCFGCQVQLTNMEPHLIELLSQLDLSYWQLATSESMPEEYDVAIVEGAVTTEESKQMVEQIRGKTRVVIAMGACATTGGLVQMVGERVHEKLEEVYGQPPLSCGSVRRPQAVSDIIAVDYEVPCCPIEPLTFVDTLFSALYGSNRTISTKTMCGQCKKNETECFYDRNVMCLGLVTRDTCKARCIRVGRPCNGCGGISPDANVDSARSIVREKGLPVEEFNKALEMFNQGVSSEIM